MLNSSLLALLGAGVDGLGADWLGVGVISY